MKKTLSALLALMLLLSLAPAALAQETDPAVPEAAGEAAEPAPAEEAPAPEEPEDPAADGWAVYPVWVGSTQVTGLNRTDVLGDGRVSYDRDTQTLTFAEYDTLAGDYGSTENALVYAEGIDLTVRGNARLSSDTAAHAIRVSEGSLTIDGDIYMVAVGSAVYVPDGDVLIRGGYIRAEATSDAGSGLLCYNAVSVTGGMLYAVGAHHGLNINYLYLSGGAVTAVACERAGVRAGSEIVISGGELHAFGGANGIFAYGDIEIGNGAWIVEAEGTSSAIWSGNSAVSYSDLLTVTEPVGGKIAYGNDEFVEADGTTVARRVVLEQKTSEPTYAFDLTGVNKTASATKGFGKAVVTGDSTKMYARVTWVYTLSGGESMAYCAMKDVQSDGQFSMVSPNAPFGATLDAVQLALVTDPNADQSGAYTPIITAKM